MSETIPSTEFDLTGKVAVVTGAGRGMGRYMALDLARYGADIVLCSRTKAELEEVGGEIEALGRKALVVKEIFRTIDGLRATGVTILLVEQNARAALEVADYGYVLEMGEIALQGPAIDLALDPRVIETYLGAARRHEGS
jgi:NAD(P)-dependent dehydrogenase (short-subunit alcohol dehydrogenase family)